MTGRVELILGGARSGKSRLGEQRAERWLRGGKVARLSYVATARPGDEEMAARIAHHQATRAANWRLIEEPWALDQVLSTLGPDDGVLIDCLTLWLTTALCDYSDSAFQHKRAELLGALRATGARVILIGNEVGHGIVPLGELSRRFVDEAGWLHQDIAALADKVDFVMAGLPLTLKGGDL
ncbi:bifunctional adenosylcobinamide kinase/adenosylcobinamide-phosphate guanylyltransferase [Pseudoalteromonas sp. OOF1S-7]|uniref:bifunctional adenosylcobinamide kinase/adenosylcobinamide-phosphate guanylyltransferase n=1 Tax=Pseudoalteromonas sp. OOF1S-7 TaxID=2917757 RepID=UPI001EF3E31F|nr:bifunctional adenosylcobinamide kinase/adenosylcobinamide-phosphate guanylyltransferase [Pseudoalteromonas sp. OOF1S-7]MCG7535323.1 bifunctional adenosylcobinamide kinase/adenosylcobinamide-phosphate guanylyltransferase [Pseudoalteromonas sp. OOF1S-7]